MTISIELGNAGVTDFTLDESLLLQNATATPGVPGDADDEDISRTQLQTTSLAFDTLLYTTLGFDTTYSPAGRIALSPTDLYTVTSTGTLTDISLSGEYDSATDTVTPLAVYDGSNFAAGGNTGLMTTDGEVIRLFSDIDLGGGGEAAAAGFDGNTVFGVDSSGDIVFAILMIETSVSSSETDLQFVMVTNEAIQHSPDTGADQEVDLGDFLSIVAAETSGFDFAGVPPGKSMHLTAAAFSGPGGVIVTPLTAVVQINTSNAFPDGVVGYGSQGINAGESVVVTWVADGLVPDFTIPNLDQNEADLEANIRFGNLDAVTEASFKIQQKVGSHVAAVKITALQTNSEVGDGTGFFASVGNASTVGGAGDDTIVEIDSVTLTRGGMSYVLSADGTFGATGVTADFVDADGGGLFAGQVVLTNVEEGDEFGYTTVSGAERLVVTGVSGNVDIGGFSNSQTGNAGAPIGDAFVIEDAAPVVDVVTDVDAGEIAALSRNLDETIDPSGDMISDGDDNYASGETESGGGASNGDLDDVPGTNGVARNLPVWSDAPAGAAAIGRLESSAGQLSALFADASTFVTFDADGPDNTFDSDGRTDSVAFDLSGTGPVKTNLIATAVVGSALDGESVANREIYLVQKSSSVIEGIVMGPDGAFGGGDDYVIIRMTLTNLNNPSASTIIYENFAPVQNPDTTLSDEAVSLLIPDSVGETLSVVWSTTARDGDLDTASDSEAVVLIDDATTILTIDDDGPGITGAQDDVALWEDGLTGGISDNDGEAEDITATGDLRDQVIGGSDGLKEFGWTSDPAFTNALDALGLTSGGVALVHSVAKDVNAAGDDVLTATAGVAGPVVYQVTLEADGDYEAKLLGALDHSRALAGQDDEDLIVINLSDGLVALEGDNDPVAFTANALRLVIEDDEGDINPAISDTSILLFDATSTFSDSGFLAYGADGPGAFVITGFTNPTLPVDSVLGTVSGSLSAGDTVLTYNSSVYGDFFRITLDGTAPGGYTADVLIDAPLVEIPLIGGSTTPGGPIEEFTPPAPGDIVTFDGFLFTDPFTGSLLTKYTAGDLEGGPDEDDDDVNISNKGAAVFDNQFDFGEGLTLNFGDDIAGIRILVDGGTGGATNFDLRIAGYNDGLFVSQTDYLNFELPKGNTSGELTFMPTGDVDQIIIVHDITDPNGFRIPEIFAFQHADIDDMQATVTVTADDFDDDPETDTFAWFIDGDGDGVIS